MIDSFEYKASPAHIIFGPGAIGRTKEVLASFGCKRALVLTTQQQAHDGEALAERIGSRAVGVFSNATMHTPKDVTDAAQVIMRQTKADCTVAFGGGSTTGLGKALAYRLNTPQLVIPTTYAGSEVTPVLGQTDGGEKTTVSDPSILPQAVIYDPQLTLGLPTRFTVTSAFNAMAHAVEGLYAQDRNPFTSVLAIEGIRAFHRALPVLASTPEDVSARSDALYGAWACGTVLGTVGMSLHHKLCHVLGGAFGLPHADMHTILLPHATAFNEIAVPDLLRPAAMALGGQNAGPALYDFAQHVGAPSRLRDLGLTAADLEHAADLALRKPYWNPRDLDRDGVLSVLQAAWSGSRPGDNT